MATPTKVTTELKNEIPEGSTPTLGLTFTDENGNVLTGNPTEATMTLYDKATEVVINGREDLDILSSVTLGVLAFTFVAADTVLLNEANDREVHVAQLTWTWNLGASVGRALIEMTIKQLAKVVSE